MIRPAIRNVFDSQSTRKSRATWSKKFKRISLSPPPQWFKIDNSIGKLYRENNFVIYMVDRYI